MAEKVKISREDVKFLRKDIELEADVVEKLVKMQEDRKEKVQGRIETARKESLDRYKARIEAIKKAKVHAVQKYDKEIKEYQLFVKVLENRAKEVKPKVEKKIKKKIER